MWVFNITTKVDYRISEDWVNWQKNENIPAMMETGVFVDFKFYKLLDQEDIEGFTYIIQYFITSLDLYDTYVHRYQQAFIRTSTDKWGNQIISFKTFMQTVQ